MVTKEQAQNCKHFKQTREATKSGTPHFDNGRLVQNYDLQKTVLLEKPRYWRASGKCQTWKTRPNEFKLPVKHGLYNNAHITHENAHLFEVDL
jgi:hypothetical protein